MAVEIRSAARAEQILSTKGKPGDGALASGDSEGEAVVGDVDGAAILRRFDCCEGDRGLGRKGEFEHGQYHLGGVSATLHPTHSSVVLGSFYCAIGQIVYRFNKCQSLGKNAVTRSVLR